MEKKSMYFNRLRLKCLNSAAVSSLLYRKLFALYSFVLGYDIKYYTQIGDNFEIFHGARGTVINPNTGLVSKNELDSASDDIMRVFNSLYQCYAKTLAK